MTGGMSDMCEIAFSIPNEVLYDTKMSKQDTLAFAKRAVALCYYTQSKVSQGYCAQIADMSKEEFIKYLGANGISIFQYDDEQEFIEEMNNA
jgi:predicted HTH domain antitoxin